MLHMDFQQTQRYQTCQALFDRTYPNFRNAGQHYQDILGRLITPSTRVLELGCGRESLAAPQFDQARTSVGIDLGFDDLTANQTVAHPVLATGEELPFAPAAFDVITSQWVMEHIAEPRRVFGEMARVLRPGGHIVIFTTNWRNYVPRASYLLPHMLQSLLATQLLKRPAHETFPVYYRANTQNDIARHATQFGLVMRQCLYSGNPFYFAFSPPLFRLALWYEQMTDAPRRRQLKLYMVVVLQKAA